MTRMIAVLCLAGSLAGAVHAREFEVRLLEGTVQNGVWGTAEFAVRVHESGLLGSVRVRGHELIRQAGRFHTSPVPPNSDSGAHAGTTPGHGSRGSTPAKPGTVTRDERGKRVFEFTYQVTSPEVLDRTPLCRVTQTVTITPNGEIHVVYDCEWVHTVRWHVFRVLLTFNEVACQNHDYLILTGERGQAGTLEPGPPTERRFGRRHFEQLSVSSDAGRFHIVWRDDTVSSFHWSKMVHLITRPPNVGRRHFVYRGHKARIAYSILLPVSQQ